MARLMQNAFYPIPDLKILTRDLSQLRLKDLGDNLRNILLLTVLQTLIFKVLIKF